MMIPQTLEYLRRTRHLPHRPGYPMRRRATIAQRVAGTGTDSDARLRYLVRGPFLADVYRTPNEPSRNVETI